MLIDVVIPSKNIANLLPCMKAVCELHSDPSIDLHLIVVDDGIEWAKEVEVTREFGAKLFIVAGEKPFIFARNINIGIRSVRPGAYVALLNDDALVTSDGGFWHLAQAMLSATQFGVVSATTNLAGNPQQHRRMDNAGKFQIRPVSKLAGHSAPVVAFVCAMISPECLLEVGLLDERFDKYGFDDNDYCRRAHNAGFQIGVFDDCYVDHGRLQPTFRKAPSAAGDIMPAWQIYLEKWGTL
jgi:GT2 family glycosyltransferase